MTARRILSFLLCTVVLVLVQSVDVFGQPGGFPDPDNPVPISGIEYLIGGGLVYGIRSLIKSRKKHSD